MITIYEAIGGPHDGKSLVGNDPSRCAFIHFMRYEPERMITNYGYGTVSYGNHVLRDGQFDYTPRYTTVTDTYVWCQYLFNVSRYLLRSQLIPHHLQDRNNQLAIQVCVWDQFPTDYSNMLALQARIKQLLSRVLRSLPPSTPTPVSVEATTVAMDPPIPDAPYPAGILGQYCSRSRSS